MKATKPGSPGKKYYTVQEANATLPLLRVILRDITNLAGLMRDRHERLVRLQNAGAASSAHAEEIQALEDQLAGDVEQMQAYENELRKLHVELKDYFTGLIDFLCVRDNREVYLCWKLDEPEVAHWHEL